MFDAAESIHVPDLHVSGTADVTLGALTGKANPKPLSKLKPLATKSCYDSPLGDTTTQPLPFYVPMCTFGTPSSFFLLPKALLCAGVHLGVRNCGRTCQSPWMVRWLAMETSPRAEAGGRAAAPSGLLDSVKAAAGRGKARAHSSIAVVAAQKSHTYGQLLLSASALASQLEQQQHCISAKHGDEQQKRGASGLEGHRIGIIAKPCAEFVAGLWATWLSGAIAVPLALTHPEAELMHVLRDADIAVVVATEEFRAHLQPLVERCSACFVPLSPVPHLEKVQEEQDRDTEAQVQHALSSQEASDKPALIIYTSGTTGKPKGAVHTLAGLTSQARILSEAWGYSPQDRMLHCLPLHHVHGLINALLAPLHAGAAVEFLPKFSTRMVWQRWRECEAITVFTGVPTIYVRLLQGYDAMDAESRSASAAAASRLRLMMCGSSSLPLPIMERWQGITGHRLLDRYGMTEFGMAISNPLEGERRPGCVGKALPGVELKILEYGQGQGGELCVKSPSLFKEYWRQAKLTQESFTPDGFFRTGDSVIVVDGYVKILGRTSVDILKSGGYKLSALEIEGVLLEHPAIQECAVLGIPDEEYGEIIAAIIVPDARIAEEAAARMEPPVTLLQLRSWASNRMAHYKMPQQLHVWSQLPRNAMGKVNKKELRQSLLHPNPCAT